MTTDWQMNLPALGLALSQSRPSSSVSAQVQGQTLGSRVLRQCVVPALEARTARDFVGEVSRRLPLFAALHVKLLGDVVSTLDPTEDQQLSLGGQGGIPQTISQAYQALEEELRRWAGTLDDVTRAELDIAISTLNRSNQLLLGRIEKGWEPDSEEVADLFRTAILVEFLVSCLWHLAEINERPAMAAQIVYNLRYAVLDHAAAVRRLSEPHHEGIDSPPSSPETTSEDSFWTSAGALPLAELGDDV